jgi:hypothetical protein
VNTGFESAHRAQIQGQEVEEECSIRLRSQRDHLPLLLFSSFLEDVLQIRGFATQPSAVVHDLTINLAGCKVDETQRLSSRHAEGAKSPKRLHL